MALVALAAVVAVACGGGAGGDGAADTSTGADVAASDGAGGGDALPGGDADGGATAGTLVLELFGMDPETTSMTEASLAVRTRVYDADALTPVAGVQVDYALEVVTAPTVGSADGSVSDPSALTNSQGTAVVFFNTGTGAGAVYRITASVQGIDDPVTLTVTVISQPTGAVQVSFDYDGADAPPTDVRVLLQMAVYECDGFNPGAPPATPLQADVPFADGTWTSGPLQQSPNWNVLLIGLDAAGSVVAGGCASNIRVVADVTAPVSVTLTPVGLHLPGVYELTETLDLSAARPADAELLVTTLQTLLGDPRGGLVAALGDAVAAQIAATDPDGTCADLVRADLPGAVEAAVPATADWVVPFEGLPARLDAALVAVTLEADVTVTGSAPGPFAGDIAWRAVSAPFDGGTTRWEPSDFGAVVYPIRLADDTSTWTARIDGYDDLVVEAHALVLEPGRLAAALVTDDVLAGAPGAPGPVADVAVAFFECGAVVAGLGAEATTCLSDNQMAVEDVTTLCESLVREHVAPVTDILEGWVTPSVSLELAGAGTVVDADQDLGVDRVDGGALQGTLTYDGAPAGAVTGSFSMTR